MRYVIELAIGIACIGLLVFNLRTQAFVGNLLAKIETYINRVRCERCGAEIVVGPMRVERKKTG